MVHPTPGPVNRYTPLPSTGAMLASHLGHRCLPPGSVLLRKEPLHIPSPGTSTVLKQVENVTLKAAWQEPLQTYQQHIAGGGGRFPEGSRSAASSCHLSRVAGTPAAGVKINPASLLSGRHVILHTRQDHDFEQFPIRSRSKLGRVQKKPDGVSTKGRTI